IQSSASSLLHSTATPSSQSIVVFDFDLRYLYQHHSTTTMPRKHLGVPSGIYPAINPLDRQRRLPEHSEPFDAIDILLDPTLPPQGAFTHWEGLLPPPFFPLARESRTSSSRHSFHSKALELPGTSADQPVIVDLISEDDSASDSDSTVIHHPKEEDVSDRPMSHNLIQTVQAEAAERSRRALLSSAAAMLSSAAKTLSAAADMLAASAEMPCECATGDAFVGSAGAAPKRKRSEDDQSAGGRSGKKQRTEI
ncbi:hypothetical protein F4818DRAFT_453290, partial [Hypoxylon cercidicola]